MEALALPGSDDSDSTEVFEYDTDLADEDMHSATASVEDMDQDDDEENKADDAGDEGDDAEDEGGDAEDEGDDEDMFEESSLVGQAINRSTLVFDDDQDSDYVASDSPLEYEDGAEEANPTYSSLATTLVSPPTVAVYQNVGFHDTKEAVDQALHID